MSDLHSGDVVFCGFEDDILEYNDSDERSVIHSCENNSYLLGLCAYEPEEIEFDAYCYQLEDYGKKGFGYRVTSDPKNYDAEEFYQSKIASLAIAWVKKEDYIDPDTEIFCILTTYIG